jgi:hypothetical protein
MDSKLSEVIRKPRPEPGRHLRNVRTPHGVRGRNVRNRRNHQV